MRLELVTCIVRGKNFPIILTTTIYNSLVTVRCVYFSKRMQSACSNLDLLTPKCFVRRRKCRVFLAMFNPSMDKRQLNLAARILDPVGPLTQLWEAALAANEHQTGLDPSIVVEFVRQAISLVGNASFCGLSDRRKILLAKVSPECLDLLDETNLFEKNSTDLFGKKFKKAMLKKFQHDKIMDGLFGRNNHGNRKQFFRQQPGKGPGFFPGSNARPGIRQWSDSPQIRGWQAAKTPFRSFAPGTKRRYQQNGK